MAAILTAPESTATLEPSPWIRDCPDAQIARLAELLDERPTAALSLDCFDTLLWRSVPKPADVFLLLGHRLRELGALEPSASPQLFMKLRIFADQEARARSFEARHTHEVHLETIYGWKGWSRLTSLSGPELAQQELLVERSVTTADPTLAGLLRRMATREPHRPLLIVSDTYFDTDAIRFLLEGAALGMLCDVPVYASCERGVNKAGGLLRVALHDLGVDPGNCIHVGDSVEADVNPTAKAGATAIHLPSSPGVMSRALFVEGWHREATETSELVDPVAGDSGLTAVRGRILRQRPGSIDDGDAIYWNVGATVVGPVLTGFAEWVHDRAGALGIDKALCLMREGRFLAQLLDAVPPSERRCTALPFWASREACVRATFFEADRAELHRALWGAEVPTPLQILDTLGLGVEEVPGGEHLLTGLAEADDKREAANAFIELLAAHQDVRERIVERSAERRKAYVRYLLDAVGDTDRPVAVVDLGYGGTIQALLARMAAAEGVDLDLRGLYLFTSSRALVRQLGGHLIEGFLADPGAPRTELAALDRSPEILEAIVTTFEGSLLEITPDGGLTLTPRGPESSQDRQRTMAQDGIIAFQRAWYDFCATSTLAAKARLGESPRVLHRILKCFLAKPGIEVARAFAGWTQEASLGSEQNYPFVPEALIRCAPYLAPEHLTYADWTDLHWVGAAAAYAGLEDQVSWLQEGHVGVGTFLNANHHGYLRLEVGATGKEGATEVPLHWNKVGAGVISWHGSSTGDRIVVSTSGTHAVLRLDRVRIERADGTTQTFDWRGVPRAVPTGIELTASQPVAEGMALISDDAVFELTAGTQGGTAPITGVEILYAALRA